ncbi:MAG: hypothetical protein DCC46_01205, partial [Armatimonadetes bacterium]
MQYLCLAWLVFSGFLCEPHICQDPQTTLRLVAQLGHSSNVERAAFSPDGTRIVTASYDGTARVWDARTGKELLKLEGHSREIYDAAFSPDGTRIVTASDDGTARVWDAQTGKELLKIEDHSFRSFMVASAAFSPDG